MSNWKGIVKNSPDMRAKAGRSKGKFTPQRDPNGSNDNSFIEQLK